MAYIYLNADNGVGTLVSQENDRHGIIQRKYNGAEAFTSNPTSIGGGGFNIVPIYENIVGTLSIKIQHSINGINFQDLYNEDGTLLTQTNGDVDAKYVDRLSQGYIRAITTTTCTSGNFSLSFEVF